jgi:transposase
MTIKLRPITPEESEVLDRWQRCDDAVRYRRARILRLAAAKWRCPAIAQALALHVETVRLVIKAFNEAGIAGVTPRPGTGGRPPGHSEAVAEAAEELVRQEPPAETGRATWTLRALAQALTARCAEVSTLSHEAVRRLLNRRGILYRRAKSWLTSPDPLYGLRKGQRDRLLAWARRSPDGVAVWLDQSWFVRWPYRFWAWARKGKSLTVAQRWNEPVETTALYAGLEDETQEALLHWAATRPNSEETVQFLEALMVHWCEKGKRFVVLFWDKAPWHTSGRTRAWLRAYNRRAKRDGLTRLIVCPLPTRSPWLMPLEPIFGFIKHQVLAGRRFSTIAELQGAVAHYFSHRVPDAKVRRDLVWDAAPAASP